MMVKGSKYVYKSVEDSVLAISCASVKLKIHVRIIVKAFRAVNDPLPDEKFSCSIFDRGAVLLLDKACICEQLTFCFSKKCIFYEFCKATTSFSPKDSLLAVNFYLEIFGVFE